MDNLRNQRADLGRAAPMPALQALLGDELLYIGTFGSFIGFSFAFGQVLQINFLAGGDTAAQAVAARRSDRLPRTAARLDRPAVRRQARRPHRRRQDHALHVRRDDLRRRHPGGRRHDGRRAAGAPPAARWSAYVVGFIVLFILSGIGNGSTYKMIPSIFEAKAQDRDDLERDEKAAWSRSMSGALIGFAGAIGALGGVFINVVLRASYIGEAKSATNAFWVFLALLRDLRDRDLVRVPAHAVGPGGQPASTSEPRQSPSRQADGAGPGDDPDDADGVLLLRVGCGISVETRDRPRYRACPSSRGCPETSCTPPTSDDCAPRAPPTPR